jgi:folate-dependent phosphoribosylglycinamide formyltransferase PurN
MSKYPLIDLKKIRTYPIGKRKSKTQIEKFGKPLRPNAKIDDFLKSLPKCLKADDLRSLINSILIAKRKKKPIILMLGAHPIKCGLSPILIDLIEEGFVTLLSTNGAGAIHDVEIAFWGKTSEEVEKGIEDGSFGMAKETGEIFNRIASYAGQNNLGLGEAIGKEILKSNARYKKHSLLANAYRLIIPACVHVAFGTDIVHQHPSFDPAFTGRASHLDFRILSEEVSRLNNGGVVLHFGSAVILPEVFLKALSVSRNIKGKIENFTTANFDMIQHYRPNVNVVERPTRKSGRGFSFTGHHEIMLPLLAWALKSANKNKPKRR